MYTYTPWDLYFVVSDDDAACAAGFMCFFAHYSCQHTEHCQGRPTTEKVRSSFRNGSVFFSEEDTKKMLFSSWRVCPWMKHQKVCE